MKKSATEMPEGADSVEATIETPASEPKPSRIATALAYVQGAPKWVLMTVPALVVALGGYGYLQHGDKAGDMLGSAPQAAMVGPYGQPQPFAPAAYYGPAYGNYGHGDAYGNGHGRGYGHGNGRARGNFGFSMGGDMSGDGNGWGSGYGDGSGYSRYNNRNYY